MQIAISKSKAKNLAVENALMSAATYEIVKDRGVNVRSEKTKRVREIFETFGVEGPWQIELTPRAS
jgi:ribosomal protein L4